MTKHILVVLIAAAAGLTAAPGAVAATYAMDGSNACLDMTLTVTTGSGDGPARNTVSATVRATGVAGQRVSRLHLDLEVQRRTAAAWVPFVTPRHAEAYTNTPGARLRRVWTLREDSASIDALLADHVQMRVYAKLKGVCRGLSLGPPLLVGLTAPKVAAPAPG